MTAVNCHPELCKANQRGTSCVSLHPSAKPLGVSGSCSRDDVTQPRPRISKFAKLTKKFNPAVVGVSPLSEAHRKELNVLTSYRLNDFKKKAGATHVDMSANIRRAAFTLAEVLITLGIIGIVAAMTIPTLISSYKKHAAETKLRYFYSMMTNAIKLSEVENGPIEQWTNVLDAEDFFNTYLKKYIKTAASNSVTEKCADCRSEYYVAFPNGTAMTIYDYDRAYMNFHISFLTESNPKNRFQDSSIAEGKKNGVNTFYFLIHTKGETDDTCPGTSLFLGKSGFDAYLWWKNYKWNTEKNCYEPVLPETQEEFKNELMSGEYGCATNGMYCTALIQLNGWKIPEDYPKKF